MELQNSSESEALNERFLARQKCWEEQGGLLKQSICGERAKGRGSRNRKWFLSYLAFLASTIFKTEREEYLHINKCGKGCWSEQFIKSFNKEEQKLIIKVIMEEYGVYCY